MRGSDVKGCAVATVLAGAWRASPPRPETAIEEELSAISPLLIDSGAAALGWWRVRESCVHPLSPVLQQLRAAYLCYAVDCIAYEREIVDACSTLRAGGVDPILLKGWAIARVYPETGLRPCGDIDLCVPPEQSAKAKAILSARHCRPYPIDLDHDTIPRFSELTFDELYSRSQLVNLDGAAIRIPCAEDHLRIVCLHTLKEGAWRPLWLCDVAAALESRPQNFDWNRCLGRNQTHADWVLCSLSLAARLLGAKTEDTPAHQRVKTLPAWFMTTVLKQWSWPRPPNRPRFMDQVGLRWWRWEAFQAIRQRWPNPIQATVDAGGAFNNCPRLPFQLRDCAVRAAKLCRQLSRRRTSME